MINLWWLASYSVPLYFNSNTLSSLKSFATHDFLLSATLTMSNLGGSDISFSTLSIFVQSLFILILSNKTEKSAQELLILMDLLTSLPFNWFIMSPCILVS